MLADAATVAIAATLLLQANVLVGTSTNMFLLLTFSRLFFARNLN